MYGLQNYEIYIDHSEHMEELIDWNLISILKKISTLLKVVVIWKQLQSLPRNFSWKSDNNFSHPKSKTVGLTLTPSLKLILTHLTQHAAYSNPNLEMDDVAKGVEICWLCFICCWTALLCFKLFLQLPLWWMEFVENISLQCFQFHHLLGDFICKEITTF